MQPLGRRVVVREVKPPDKIGLIFIPHQTKPQMAMLAHVCEVVAVGKKVYDERLKPGVTVRLDRLMPIQILEREKLLVVPEDDISAILED